STVAPAGTQPAAPEGAPGAVPGSGEAPKANVEGLKKAKELADAGRHQEAIEGYRTYLAKDPTGNPAVYFYLGKSLFETGDDPGATQAFGKAIELKPDMKWAHYFLGNVDIRGERYKEAADAFKKSIEIDPKYAPAHKELARVLTRLQDFPGAVQHYQEYLKLSPQAPDAKEIRDTIALLKG